MFERLGLGLTKVSQRDAQEIQLMSGPEKWPEKYCCACSLSQRSTECHRCRCCVHFKIRRNETDVVIGWWLEDSFTGLPIERILGASDDI